MAILSEEQRKDIILKNPNKHLVQKAQEMSKKYSLHLHGVGKDEALKHDNYFENIDVFGVRKKYAISNKDLMARILNEEDQVFTARGGSVNFNMTSENDMQMNALIEDVSFGISLHNWVKTFALPALRSDPMSVILMEIEQNTSVTSNSDFNGPKCYPTYKSSFEIYDYLPNGRRLEHICFQLTNEQVKQFGIKDEAGSAPEAPGGPAKSEYFRFIDDSEDVIYKRENQNITIVNEKNITQPPKIKNKWGKVPAFITSDLIKFDDPQCFTSPLEYVVELADCYFNDRSVRDLQKRYHGFAKAIEPMLKCPSCAGEGFVAGKPCPDCTPPNASRGMGFKLRTKPGDIAKFPLELLKEVPGFSYEAFFGYVTPDIETWNKQDTSLTDYEHTIYVTYWGVSNTTMTNYGGQPKQQDMGETATKTLTNLQPKYARLNLTADWAEKTETMIADFIGQFWFDTSWKGANISYGRNYILETPAEIMGVYYDMRSKGAPDVVLDEQMRKYIRAVYQNNPVQQTKCLKLFEVEPFPHKTAEQVEASPVITMPDKVAKRYYGEWVETLQDGYIVKPAITVQMLKDELKAYISKLGIAESITKEQEAAAKLTQKPNPINN